MVIVRLICHPSKPNVAGWWIQFFKLWIILSRGGSDVDFLMFADVDIDADIYFQYLRMQMLKIMLISMDMDADIWSNSTRGGQDVDFLIFAHADIGVDIYFQYLRMRMLRIMWISISTLPSHIYSTILSYAKVTCNTHTPTKTRNCCPSLLSSFPR